MQKLIIGSNCWALALAAIISRPQATVVFGTLMVQGGTQIKKTWRIWEEQYRSKKIDSTIEIVQDDAESKTPRLGKMKDEIPPKWKRHDDKRNGLVWHSGTS